MGVCLDRHRPPYTVAEAQHLPGPLLQRWPSLPPVFEDVLGPSGVQRGLVELTPLPMTPVALSL